MPSRPPPLVVVVVVRRCWCDLRDTERRLGEGGEGDICRAYTPFHVLVGAIFESRLSADRHGDDGSGGITVIKFSPRAARAAPCSPSCSKFAAPGRAHQPRPLRHWLGTWRPARRGRRQRTAPASPRLASPPASRHASGTRSDVARTGQHVTNAKLSIM